jgi:hypothetical protein
LGGVNGDRAAIFPGGKKRLLRHNQLLGIAAKDGFRMGLFFCDSPFSGFARASLTMGVVCEKV